MSAEIHFELSHMLLPTALMSAEVWGGGKEGTLSAESFPSLHPSFQKVAPEAILPGFLSSLFTLLLILHS